MVTRNTSYCLLLPKPDVQVLTAFKTHLCSLSLACLFRFVGRRHSFLNPGILSLWHLDFIVKVSADVLASPVGWEAGSTADAGLMPALLELVCLASFVGFCSRHYCSPLHLPYISLFLHMSGSRVTVSFQRTLSQHLNLGSSDAIIRTAAILFPTKQFSSHAPLLVLSTIFSKRTEF